MENTKKAVRTYESLVLFDPKLESTKLESAIGEIEKIIKSCTESETTVENLGKRTLAYPVKKATEANHALYHFKGDPSSIEKIKEEIKHNESILRCVFLRKEG